MLKFKQAQNGAIEFPTQEGVSVMGNCNGNEWCSNALIWCYTKIAI